MKNRLNLLFLMPALVCGMTISAHTVYLEQAQLIANDFLGDTYLIKNPKFPKILNVNDDSLSTTPYYIFNSSSKKGFVIVSGDDRTPSVLGYSDSDNFDPNNMPSGLKWLLNQYKAYIETLDDNVNFYAESKVDADKAKIAPLLTTKWNQNEPYNFLCPKDGDSHCPTGCVATAIAQIVNYHKWPDVGEGYFSYNMNGKELQQDYEALSLDWSLLADEYNENSSVETCNEVAKLMYACGVGAETGYTSSMSGSGVSMAKRFLIENFKYDADAKIIWRHNYYKDEWNDLMYEELRNFRPIYLQGGNHAFICDGYDGDGYFHINWGWSGLMDGYFSFSFLKPNDDDYRENLIAMINIHKRNDKKCEPTFDIINKGEIEIESFTPDYSLISLGMWYNYSRKDFNGKTGIEIENIETLESYFILNTSFIQGATSAGVGQIITGSGESCSINHNTDIASGHYKLYPVFSTDSNQIQRVRCIAGGQNHIELTVSENGEFIYSDTRDNVEPQVEVKVNHLLNPQDTSQPLDILDPSECSICFSYSVKNFSDLAANNIFMSVYNQDNEEIYNSKVVNIYEPNTEYSDLFYALFYTYLQPGVHSIVFYDRAGNPLCQEPFCFQVQGEGPEIEATYVKFNYKESSNSYDRYYFNLGLVSYHEKACSPCLNIVISRNGNEVSKTKITSYDYESYIWGHKELSFALNFTAENPLIGEYQMDVYDLYGNRLNKEPMNFTVITNVSLIETPIDLLVEYYNLQGVRVENPKNGIFIKKHAGKTTKVVL